MNKPFAKFPPEIIALQAELATGFHNTLLETLGQNQNEDWADRLVHIATHCEVVIDGVYPQEDFVALAGVLAEKLKEKRETPNRSLLILN